MKNTVLYFFMGFFLWGLTACCNHEGKATKEDLLDHVNTLMGTDSEFALSNGNTYPAVAVPGE